MESKREIEKHISEGNKIAKVDPEIDLNAPLQKIAKVAPEMELDASEENNMALAAPEMVKGKKIAKVAPCKSYVSWRHIPHVYHGAVVGTVKPSIFQEIEGIDVDLMRRQHEALVRTLRELNLKVVELKDLDGCYNTTLLLENIAISCHGIVFLTKSDDKIVQELREILKTEMSQMVVEQRFSRSKICGADVLFTGQEVIVGICETTNEYGARELADAFTDFPVTPIKMPAEADHLKNYVTVVGDNVLGVGKSRIAKEILENIKYTASKRYDVLELIEDEAANCLYLNQTLIHKAIEEIPESFKIFMNWSRTARRSICFSEFSRLNGGLTSACILTKQVL